MRTAGLLVVDHVHKAKNFEGDNLADDESLLEVVGTQYII